MARRRQVMHPASGDTGVWPGAAHAPAPLASARHVRAVRVLAVVAALAGATYLVWRVGWTLSGGTAWLNYGLLFVEAYVYFTMMGFFFVTWDTDAPAPFGTLRGHVARANSLWRDSAKEVDVLAIFHGPDAYITPSWYATKQENGKVAPTWNFAVVHAHGTLRVVDDAAWVRAHLEALTNCHEANFPEPWAVSDAPPEFTEKLIESVVGIEIVITKLSGKWKVSQNQPAQNRAGVIEGLGSCGHSEAAAMAALVEAEQKRS